MRLHYTAPAPQRPPARSWSRVFAALYDPLFWLGEQRGMRGRRRELLAQARGRVLEIGAGTGLNLALYPEGLEELVLTEPTPPMADRLERRLAETHSDKNATRPTVIRAGAEALPFPAGSFDTVVSTLVFCTVPDQAAAMREIRRVLKPDGRLLFIEHVRSQSRVLGWLQDRALRPWRAFADGCCPNRHTLDALQRAFPEVHAQPARWLAMPPLVRPLVIGSAA